MIPALQNSRHGARQPRGRHADLQSPRGRRHLPAQRRVSDRPLRQSSRLFRCFRRCARGDSGRGRQARRRSAAAAQPRRRSRRLQAPRRWQRHDAERIQGSLQAGGRRRLARPVGAGGIWRAGPAGDAEPGRHRIPELGQHGVFDVWRPDHGRDRGADGARQARTEEDVRAEDGGRRMGRHHEPHRAAMRHRSRAAAQPRP